MLTGTLLLAGCQQKEGGKAYVAVSDGSQSKKPE